MTEIIEEMSQLGYVGSYHDSVRMRDGLNNLVVIDQLLQLTKETMAPIMNTAETKD